MINFKFSLYFLVFLISFLYVPHVDICIFFFLLISLVGLVTHLYCRINIDFLLSYFQNTALILVVCWSNYYYSTDLFLFLEKLFNRFVFLFYCLFRVSILVFLLLLLFVCLINLLVICLIYYKGVIFFKIVLFQKFKRVLNFFKFFCSVLLHKFADFKDLILSIVYSVNKKKTNRSGKNFRSFSLDLFNSLYCFQRGCFHTSKDPNYSTIRKLLNVFLKYPTPKNLNYWWNFGSLAAFFLVLQILTGILLAFWYIPDINKAFASVDFIMREVRYGWLIRYMHSNGASFFFASVYIHMAKSLFYCSFAYPRQPVWYTGMVIYILMMATAFLGYILPWGQMSYWAATVITSLISTVPFVGEHLLIIVWGAPSLDQATLTRVYGLHFVLPFIIVCFVGIHISIIHRHGSNNPLGFPTQNHVPFHPYFVLKDLQGIYLSLIVFCIFVFFYPNLLSHPDNWIPADPNTTPKHIVPEWYFLPFYGILRSVPNKAAGVILLIFAIVFLFLLPLIHQPIIRVAPFRPVFMLALYMFFIAFILLGWSGSKPVAYPYYQICQFMTLYFFLFFTAVLPFVTYIENRSYRLLILQSSSIRSGVSCIKPGVNGSGYHRPTDTSAKKS